MAKTIATASGAVDCASLGSDDFQRIGEYVSGCNPSAGEGLPGGSSWYPTMGWGHGMMYGYGSYGWGFVSAVSTLLFWSICVLVIALLIRALTAPRAPGSKR